MHAPSFTRFVGSAIVFAALLPCAAIAQQDFGSLQVTRAGELLVFNPDAQPENRIWVNRKGEERLLLGWRQNDPQNPRVVVAQLGGTVDDGKFGMMLVIELDGATRNYSAGCTSKRRSPCDPADFGLLLDRASGTVTVDNAEFKRDTLEDGPDADERVRASGVLRIVGEPRRD